MVLATNWGGTADDLEHWGLPLDYQLADAWSDRPDWQGQMGQWAEVDVDALADEMIRVAGDFSGQASFAAQAAAFVREQYHWSGFAERVYAIWFGALGLRSVLDENGARIWQQRRQPQKSPGCGGSWG